MSMCMWGCLDKYIELQLGPPKQNFLAPPLTGSILLSLFPFMNTVKSRERERVHKKKKVKD